MKRAQHEKKRMVGDRIRGEEAIIFCQNALIWERVSKCKDKVTFKCMSVLCVCVCLRQRKKEGHRVKACRKTKHKAQVAHMEDKEKEREHNHWWVELIQFEWDIFMCLHNVSPHLGHQIVFYVLFLFLLKCWRHLIYVIALCFSPFILQYPSPHHCLTHMHARTDTHAHTQIKTTKHNPFPSYFRAYGIWKNLLHFLQSLQKTSLEWPLGKKGGWVRVGFLAYF